MSMDRAKQDLLELERRRVHLQSELMDVVRRVDKIKAYLEMASYYESNAIPAAVETRPSTRSRGVGEAALNAVIAHLTETGHRVRTVDLLDVLKSKGIAIAGDNAANNLSSILSRADELTSDRARGWGLKKWEPEPDFEPTDHQTEAISAPNAPAPLVEPNQISVVPSEL